MTANEKLIEQVVKSPVHSFWLKEALRTALLRDCCDAASDADLLAHILEGVANEQLGLTQKEVA
jgi:hypothetical protein